MSLRFVLMGNIMLIWFHNHCYSMRPTSLVPFLLARMNWWIINTHLLWCILSVSFLLAPSILRWGILCIFHLINISHRCSHLQSWWGTWWDGYVFCMWTWIIDSQYTPALMNFIMFNVLLDEFYRLAWEILCLFHVMNIPHSRFHLW